jgi:hypothetical protein
MLAWTWQEVLPGVGLCLPFLHACVGWADGCGLSLPPLPLQRCLPLAQGAMPSFILPAVRAELSALAANAHANAADAADAPTAGYGLRSRQPPPPHTTTPTPIRKPYVPGHTRRRIPDKYEDDMATLRRTGLSGGMRATAKADVPRAWRDIFPRPSRRHKINLCLLARVAAGLEPRYKWLPPADESAWNKVKDYLVQRTGLPEDIVHDAMCILYPLTAPNPHARRFARADSPCMPLRAFDKDGKRVEDLFAQRKTGYVALRIRPRTPEDYGSDTDSDGGWSDTDSEGGWSDDDDDDHDAGQAPAAQPPPPPPTTTRAGAARAHAATPATNLQQTDARMGRRARRSTHFISAHRIVLYAVYGPPADVNAITTRHAMHLCDNPACCNPKHLRWGTAKDNNGRRSERSRTYTRVFNKGLAAERDGDNVPPSVATIKRRGLSLGKKEKAAGRNGARVRPRTRTR